MSETPLIAELSGEITAQQAISEASQAHARAVGSLWFARVFPIVGAVLGMTIALAIGPTLNAAMFLINPAVSLLFAPVQSALAVALAVLGYGLGLNLATRSYHRRYMLGMYERGMPARVKVTYRLTDDRFVMDNGRVEYAVRWNAVAEIIRSPNGWLVVADMTTFVMLKEAFADEDEQRRIISAMLERMTPTARDRSMEARNFIES
ncbi:YcxB family protein [Croceicoccus bisphenolivorans]|uniref:YcxB family protein n=1 Tax=Croceicoccus bisphenolivorans TaxID=1783232 RepID=UPI0008295E5E|nr:YcxB family protein [Croceicoccus bisphenolivorans]